MVSDSADPAMPASSSAHTIPAGLEDDAICEVHLESDFATLHSSTPGKRILETVALPEGRPGEDSHSRCHGSPPHLLLLLRVGYWGSPPSGDRLGIAPTASGKGSVRQCQGTMLLQDTHTSLLVTAPGPRAVCPCLAAFPCLALAPALPTSSACTPPPANLSHHSGWLGELSSPAGLQMAPGHASLAAGIAGSMGLQRGLKKIHPFCLP